MRLNDGAPVWHVSISIWTPDLRRVGAAGLAERHAVRLLAGVGNDREWWIWRPTAKFGHLRVGLTPAEVASLAEMPAEHDAGPSGPERRRTPARAAS
jgi:hypothetical protein